MRIGIIGAGFAGSTHARAMGKLDDVDLVIADGKDYAKAQKLATEVHAQSVETVDEILHDPSLDAVDLAVPTPVHAELAVRAFEHDHHVIVEKPLALTLDAADAIIASARAHNKLLLVGHVVRFWSEYVRLREIVLSGQLGRPLMGTAYRLSNMPQWAHWFRDPKASGGAVVDLQIHDIDMLNWIFGNPVQVFAIGVQDADGGWNHVTTSLQYPKGGSAVAEASFMMPQDYPFSSGLRVLCENGAVEYLFRAGGAGVEQGLSQNALLVHEPQKPNQVIEVAPADPFELEIRHFVQCLRDGTPSRVVSAADARLALEAALAARKSLDTGQIITLND